MTIRIDKPDIFLVERIDRSDTNALVLNMEVKCSILMLPSAMDVSMNVTKLHIFSCLFDPARRMDSMATVLTPCWVAVKAKMSDEDNMSQLDVHVGDVTLSVSPGTIEMLTNVSRSMALEDDASAPEEPAAQADYSKIWQMTPVDTFDFTFLDTEVGVDAATYVEVVDVRPFRPELMMLTVDNFIMTIESGQVSISKRIFQKKKLKNQKRIAKNSQTFLKNPHESGRIRKNLLKMTN